MALVVTQRSPISDTYSREHLTPHKDIRLPTSVELCALRDAEQHLKNMPQDSSVEWFMVRWKGVEAPINCN